MPKKHPRIKPKTVIFCDDIRREENGKQILIGVYQSDLVTTEFPVTLSLSLLLVFESPQTGNVQARLEVRGGTATLGANMAIEMTEVVVFPKTTSLAMTGIPIQVKSPGSLQVAFKQYDEDWIIIGELGIKPAPPPLEPIADPDSISIAS